jgi:hypothetical protein
VHFGPLHTAAQLHLDAALHHVDDPEMLGLRELEQEPSVPALVFEVHDEVLGGLGDPGGGRVRGGAQDADPSTGVLDDRKHV